MILVLGHGKHYVSDTRCSPVPVSQWLKQPHVGVDWDPDIRPDIVYDLREMPWRFAKESAYSSVVDTCGLLFYGHYYNNRGFRNPRFAEEVFRVLCPGGTFEGRDFTWNKPIREKET
jgi:hypothetical protein